MSTTSRRKFMSGVGALFSGPIATPVLGQDALEEIAEQRAAEAALAAAAPSADPAPPPTAL